jgi:hypothetical protein
VSGQTGGTHQQFYSSSTVAGAEARRKQLEGLQAGFSVGKKEGVAAGGEPTEPRCSVPRGERLPCLPNLRKQPDDAGGMSDLSNEIKVGQRQVYGSENHAAAIQ